MHILHETEYSTECCPLERVGCTAGAQKAFGNNPWRGQIRDSLEDTQNYLCGLEVIGWRRNLPEERNGRLSTRQSQKASRENGRKRGKQVRKARRHNWPRREGWSNSGKNKKHWIKFGLWFRLKFWKKKQKTSCCSMFTSGIKSCASVLKAFK